MALVTVAAAALPSVMCTSFSAEPPAGTDAGTLGTPSDGQVPPDAAEASSEASLPAAIDPDLVAWWTFDENTGLVARDSSPNQNHGSITAASWVPGRLGAALAFDPSAPGRVRVAHSDSLASLTAAVTIALWVQPPRKRPR
jgi:hypothetical protein